MGNFVEFYEFLRLQMVFGIVRCSDIVILIQLFYEINSEQVSLNLRCSMEQYLIKGGNEVFFLYRARWLQINTIVACGLLTLCMFSCMLCKQSTKFIFSLIQSNGDQGSVILRQPPCGKVPT